MNMFRFAARFLIAFALAIPAAYAQTPQQYTTLPSIAALKSMTNRPQVVQVTGTNAGTFNLNQGACVAADDLTQVQPTSGTTVCYVRAMSPYAVGATGSSVTAIATGGTVARMISNYLADMINVRDFGALGTATSMASASVSIASGTSALTVAGGSFTTANIGQTIVVPGAGTAGGVLVSTISAVGGATSLTLSGTAATTLSAAAKTISWGPDDTAGLQAALNVACGSASNRLNIGRGTYIHTGLSLSVGCDISGAGRANTILWMVNPTGDDIAFSGGGSQKLTISDVDLYEASPGLKTAGYALSLTAAYFPIVERVNIIGYNGVLADHSATVLLKDIDMGGMTGTRGIELVGQSDVAAVYGFVLDNVNGNAVGNTQLRWLNMSSFAYSGVVKHATFQYGATCVVMEDPANTGTSLPRWLFAPHLECDHANGPAIDLVAGSSFTLGPTSWIGSTQADAAIIQRATFGGTTLIQGSRINGNNKEGIVILGGTDTKILDNAITANGQGTGGTHYDEVRIGAGVSNVQISNNYINQVGDGNSSTDLYCINIQAGAGNNISVTNNNASGCAGGSISQGATGNNVTLSGNIGYEGVNVGTFAPGNDTPYTFFRGRGLNADWPFVMQGIYDGAALDTFLIFNGQLGSAATRANPTITAAFTAAGLWYDWNGGALTFWSTAAGTNVAVSKTLEIHNDGSLRAHGVVRPQGYTVGGLPVAPGAGARAYVTDATACTFGGALTGGGSTYCPVSFNGTTWQGG